MPELPEVETTKSGLQALIAGQTITDITVRQGKLRRPVDEKALAALHGQRISDLARRAKYLFIHTTDPRRSVLIHLGMSGSLRVNPCAEALKKHDHIIFTLDNGMSVRFHDPRRFGQCDVIHPQQWPDYLLRLGPEPLDDVFNGDYLYDKSRGRRIAVKAFIMDQAVVVGVGNIYATEALFYSHIHPASAAGKVTRKAYHSLSAEIKQVLTRAISQGGTTLRDFLHSDGRGGYFQQTLAVYGNAGEPCPTCGNALSALTIAGRNSAYCAHCQRRY